MPFRTFAVLTIQSTTVPQPLVGSWITAGIGAPSNQPLTLTLGTASSAGNDATNIFQAGDDVLLIDPAGTRENARISSLTGNTVTLGYKHAQPTGNIVPVTELPHVSGAFGTGTFIIPALSIKGLFVAREDGATGTWQYIGNAYNMSATFRRIVKLANEASGVMPYNYSADASYFGDPISAGELWTLGLSVGDGYNVSYLLV